MEAILAELWPLVQNHPTVSAVIVAYPMLVTMASMVTAITGTPDPSTPAGRLYRSIEVVALVVGKAKDIKTVPADRSRPAIGSHLGMLFCALLVSVIVSSLGACTMSSYAETGSAVTGAVAADYQKAKLKVSLALLEGEIMGLCSKPVDTWNQSFADGLIQHPEAIPLLCPNVDRFMRNFRPAQ